MQADISCWVLSDGRRGIENQAIGLAEALGRLRPLEIKTKLLTPSRAFKMAQPRLQLQLKSKPAGYGLKPPYPQIAIGCGRQAIAPLMALKKQLCDDIFTVYAQDPRISPRHFDLVVAPEHDAIKGNNVVSIIGSPNRITNERLVIDTLKFGDQLARLPAPRVAMLIGGKSKSHKLTADIHDSHLQFAQRILELGRSLLITTSRRTPAFATEAYMDLAANNKNVWMWDGVGENPYFAFLGAADIILVTEDSTNMLTESCATGKPVYTLAMQGGAGKFAALYETLAARCHVSRFEGVFDGQDYPALNETARAAEELWHRFDAR